MDLQIWVYVTAAVVGIAVAFFLAHLARQSARPKITPSLKGGGPAADISFSPAFKQAVYEEVSKVADSTEKSRAASSKLSNIFAGELQKKVESKLREVDKKYNSIIKEKSQSEEMAWGKYKKILADKKETEAVVHSIAEGLLVVDSKGNVVMMNPAAEKLLGVSKKDRIGKSVLEDLKKEQLFSMVRGSPDQDNREIEIISKEDETKKIIRSSSAVIENENGRTVGMVSVLSDITKQRQLDHMKSEFVSNVTHELRTPLVAVQKALSLLLDGGTGSLSETQGQFLNIADRNLKRLGILIDDLLDLAKLEAGRMELRLENTSIEKVIEESVISLNAWAEAKSIKIEKVIRDRIPDINIDPAKITQVLVNLIGNAIKFTPNNGNITVEAGLKSGNNEIEVSVSDTGMGIAEEDLTKIFDKFYQSSGERGVTDISGGTGIGLSIVKELIDMHGGKILAENIKGGGARFVFTLPLS